MSDWQDVYLNTELGGNLYVDYFDAKGDKPNLIFCWTDLEAVPLKEVKKCYQPFIQYGFNIFAMDFSGLGKRKEKDVIFSEKSITADFKCLIAYIRSLNKNPIFVFGDTGTGGIWGQYLVSTSHDISGFAQFGCVVYRNSSILGLPSCLVAVLYPILKLCAKRFPQRKMTIAVPKYSGYHAEKDNNFYLEQLKKNPDVFRVSLSYIKTLMYILWDKNSPIKDGLTIPTIVFKTKHDRYFPCSYFDKYYQNLKGPKKLVEVDDVHNAYYFEADFFAQEVAAWFEQCLDKE